MHKPTRAETRCSEIHGSDVNPKPPLAIVTGAAGFIGSWCAARLARDGWAVVGLDRNWPNPTSPAHPEYDDFIIAELNSPDTVRNLIEHHAPRAIVHAAGPASVEKSFADPHADFTGQVIPWLSILEAVRLSGSSASVVLCSSAAVYGNPALLPVRETSELKPISPYGFHKLHKEMLLREYITLHGLRGSIARIFSTFGPGLRKLAVWDITRRMMAGDQRVHGTGLETRDYLYVEDVAAALARIVESAPNAGEAYNVASGTETSIFDMAGMVGRELGLTRTAIACSPAELATKGKPIRWCADTAALQALGLNETISLATGIARTVDWISSQ